MSKLINNSIFIQRSISLYPGRFDYSLTEYKTAKEKVTIICKKHGAFKITPNSHCDSKSNGGCYPCGVESTATKKKQQRFNRLINDCEKIHGDRYDYSLVTRENYTGSNNKIPIICKIHGVFYQSPRKHVTQKNGCKICRNESFHIQDFPARCKEIHFMEDYDYTETVYSGMNKNIKVICKTHGPFEILARYFLDKKRGCKKCSIKESNKSRKEIEWLNFLNVPIKNRNIFLKIGNKNFNVDAIDYEEKKIYEFYGDFFHGNPLIYKPDEINPLLKESYGDLYKKTIEKENLLKTYKHFEVITIWESEFDKMKINKSKTKCKTQEKGQ